MDKYELQDRLRLLITDFLKDRNIILVDLSFRYKSEKSILQILVDRQGGITLQQCALLNNEIGELLDKVDIIEGTYILEVSSPGIDRPLINRDDFSRCLNRKVRIFFKESEGKTEEITGIITSVTDSAVNIDSEGKLVEMPFERISKAKQVI